jgi:large subunit ribosomal protein L3
MGGRMGTDRVTVKNLQVVDIDSKENILVVSGPVPGPTNGLLIIKKIAEGKLSDLIEKTPKAEIKEGEPEEEASSSEGSSPAGEKQNEN